MSPSPLWGGVRGGGAEPISKPSQEAFSTAAKTSTHRFLPSHPCPKPLMLPVSAAPARLGNLHAALHRHLEHQLRAPQAADRGAVFANASARHPVPAGNKVPRRVLPREAFAELGYGHVEISGQKGYHGVATIARRPMELVDRRRFCDNADCRHISVRFGSGGRQVTLHNFYVPAGGDEPDPEINPKFRHKLDFVSEMNSVPAAFDEASASILVGDLNIAPLEHDVWSHKQLLKVVSHTPIETESFEAMRKAGGWVDLLRLNVPPRPRSTPGGATARRTGTRPTGVAVSTTSGRRRTSRRICRGSRSCARRGAGIARPTRAGDRHFDMDWRLAGVRARSATRAARCCAPGPETPRRCGGEASRRGPDILRECAGRSCG